GQKRAEFKVPSVPLGNLAQKWTVDQLAAFLMDPLKSRPNSRMPASGLNKAEAEAVAVYLLRDQMSNPQSANNGPSQTRGLKYVYYEAIMHTAKLERIQPLKPKREG